MIDLNQMVNQEIMRERLEARNNLASEILKILSHPQSPSDYIDKIQEAEQRLREIKREYQKFQSGIPFLIERIKKNERF